MKVIVVDNPFVAMLLEMFLGDGVDGPIKNFLEKASKVDMKTAGPEPGPDPDFYLKPNVEKMLLLKVKSNTDPGKMYDVTRDREGNLYCTCTGFKYRGKCSHVTKVKGMGNGMRGGIGLCLECQYFTHDERDINTRGRQACRHPYTMICPPMSGCRHFDRERKYKTEAAARAALPMVFPVEGALLQTFQSRHFPEVRYEVKMKDGDMVCTCRGFQFHGNCKHVQYMKSRINQGTVSI